MSIWNDNKILKKWAKKHSLRLFNLDFNFNLADPLTDPLIEAISKYIGVDKQYIYVGAGISQFISVIINLQQWKTIYLSKPEFNLYAQTAKCTDKKVVEINAVYTHDFINSLKNCNTNTNDLLCLSSPRWFSGELFSQKELKEILRVFNGKILIDEAYIDYSDTPSEILDLCLSNERIILVRSFSKKFFASGLRAGYLVTKQNIPNLRNTLIAPHSISSHSANFIVALLNDQNMLDYFSAVHDYVKINRELVCNALKDEKAITIIKSNANFISLIFKDKHELNKVYENLKGLPGIQKFESNINFIKIWISSEYFSNLIISKVKEVLK